MASAVFFVNQRGEEIVSRHYRSDISRTSIDAFRSQVLAESPTSTPLCVGALCVAQASLKYV
jgi:hypothetical protein